MFLVQAVATERRSRPTWRSSLSAIFLVLFGIPAVANILPFSLLKDAWHYLSERLSGRVHIDLDFD